jgi:16S rRNA (uracil1498-N3)-methyltransferase
VKQFILGMEPDRDNTVRLTGNDYRYLVRVRRLAAGEFFPALLPGGRRMLVQVLSVDSGVLTGKCLTLEEAVSFGAAPPPAAVSQAAGDAPAETQMPRVILFQALPKGDKMDLIVRQAAEGGITEVVPFVSEFSVAKINAENQKYSRWERIIREARQQSGSKTATSVRRPLTAGGLFEYWGKMKETGALGILFHHQGLEKESLHSYLDSVPQIVALVIGPEGGFSSKEVFLFLENGFKPLTIGDNILRTETAALYCAAAVKIILLERNSWELNKLKPYSA